MGIIQCILFDMDGVLIDAKEWHADAFLLACKMQGVILSKSFHETHLEALPTRTKIQLLVDKGLVDPNKSDAIYRLKQDYTEKLLKERNLYDQQKIDLLSRLKSAGYLLGVCSNSIGSSVVYITKQMGIYDFFNCVLSNNDVINPKPDPEIYCKAMQLLNISPGNTLIIEDSDAGSIAAKASGAHLFRVKNATEVTGKNIDKAFSKLGEKHI